MANRPSGSGAGSGQGGVRLTSANSAIGTPLYMSPEQIQADEATVRSDVFALGLIFTQLLTGKLPWGENDESAAGQLMARLVSPPRSLGELYPQGAFSLQLQGLVSRMLARDPAMRPPDGGAVLRHLQQLTEAQSVSPAAKNTDGTLAVQAMTPPSFRRPFWLHPRARAGIAGVSLLTLAVLVGVGMKLWLRSPATTQAATTSSPVTAAKDAVPTTAEPRPGPAPAPAPAPVEKSEPGSAPTRIAEDAPSRPSGHHAKKKHKHGKNRTAKGSTKKTARRS